MASPSKLARASAIRRLVALVLLLFSSIATASKLEAQIRGVVSDTAGIPLSGVVVSLWAEDSRIQHTTTDAAGAFFLPLDERFSAPMLSFERAGYSTLAVPASKTSFVQRFIMKPAAVAVSGLNVRGIRRTCPNRDSPQARALWNQARRRYLPDTGSRGYDVVYLRGDGSRLEDEVGMMDESRLRPGRMASLDPRGVVPVETQIRAHGYGVRLPWDQPGYRSLNPEYFAWRYPALHGKGAYHFASDLFGELHLLSILERDTEQVVLAFCARDRRRPYIEGTLSISSDSSFSFAEWRFHTPKPDERAGGQVTFVPPADTGGQLHLVPSQGLFWRRQLGRNVYYQNGYDYVEWVISSDASRPALELRAATPNRP